MTTRIKRDRTVFLGTISHATMQPRDLIPAFASELERIAQRSNKSHRALIKEANAIEDYDSDSADRDMIDSVLEELFDALNSYAPAYCYFGAHEGDGSDYGFWPSLDSLDEDTRSGEVLKVNDLSDVPRGYCGTIMQVSDHGNVELYARSKRGKLKSLWSCV